MCVALKRSSSASDTSVLPAFGVRAVLGVSTYLPSHGNAGASWESWAVSSLARHDARHTHSHARAWPRARRLSGGERTHRAMAMRQRHCISSARVSPWRSSCCTAACPAPATLLPLPGGRIPTALHLQYARCRGVSEGARRAQKALAAAAAGDVVQLAPTRWDRGQRAIGSARHCSAVGSPPGVLRPLRLSRRPCRFLPMSTLALTVTKIRSRFLWSQCFEPATRMAHWRHMASYPAREMWKRSSLAPSDLRRAHRAAIPQWRTECHRMHWDHLCTV